uniref:Ig-like domain-containing protein n=1 Tax=Mesocestoides corti TaxID=53468 RepID=A0A5K3FJQ5_MESCO
HKLNYIHCVSARRLNRPSFVTLPPIFAEPLADNYAGALASAQFDNYRALLGLGSELQLALGGPSDLLNLPQSFGTLFLGETFSCHINLHNESQFECKNVVLKVAIQGRNEYVPLQPHGISAGQLPSAADMGSGGGGGGGVGCTLGPNENLNVIFQHEMKDLGANTLVCSVSYTVQTQSPLPSLPLAFPARPPPSNEEIGPRPSETPYNFMKNFKFMVEKPFDFKQTSVATSTSDVYVEAQIENLMPYAIMMERISWEVGPHIKVTDMNTLTDWTRSKPNHVRGSNIQNVFMAPRDVWRLLYRTQPPIQGVPGDLKLGNLDITWRSAMGERGHLQTFPCPFNAPRFSDVSVRAIQLPTRVAVGDPFQVTCEVTNRSNRSLDLLLCRPDSSASEIDEEPPLADQSAPAFIWTGVTHRRLESLEPNAAVKLVLEFVPIMIGLQEMPPIHLREISTENRFNVSCLGQILVTCAS